MFERSASVCCKRAAPDGIKQSRSLMEIVATRWIWIDAAEFDKLLLACSNEETDSVFVLRDLPREAAAPQASDDTREFNNDINTTRGRHERQRRANSEQGARDRQQ